MLLRQYGQLGFSLLTPGLSRLSFVFKLFVLDSAHPDFFMLLHGFACLSLVLLVVDHAAVGFSPLLQSSSHLESALSVLDSASAESFALIRQLACLGSVVSMCGLSCIGSCFILSLIAQCDLDLFLPSHSLACLGLAIFPLDYVATGLLVSLQSFA